LPFVHGSKTSVYLGGLDLSPYLNAAEWSSDLDTGETTTFNSTWKTHIAGTFGSKATFAGYYDPTMTDLEATLGVDYSLTSGVLTICAGGGTIADDARLLSIATSNYTQTSPVGGVVGVKWDAQTSAPVGFGHVLHPMGADTNTTTGAERDDAAATSLGWIAHLHVTGITGGGSWVVKLQDAAVTNTYSDLTGGAFTTTAVKSSQRLVSATNTTALRRYVRYVATRTGGAGGDTVSFQLSYSRNS
jgi:hypothetical protein